MVESLSCNIKLIILIILNSGLTTNSPNDDCSRSRSCSYPSVTTRICSSSCQLKCGRDSCRGLEARCNGQSDCFATCGGRYSCSRAVSDGMFNLPLNDRPMTKFIGNWGLNCKGDKSCSKAQVDTIKGDLGCTGKSSCEELEVNSIDGDLKCEGIQSCQRMTAKCKDGATCTAKCNNNFACSKPDPFPNTNTTLFIGHWNLECTQYFSCQDVEARCPAGKSCTATCTGLHACHGANLIGNWIRVGTNSGY